MNDETRIPAAITIAAARVAELTECRTLARQLHNRIRAAESPLTVKISESLIASVDGSLRHRKTQLARAKQKAGLE